MAAGPHAWMRAALCRPGRTPLPASAWTDPGSLLRDAAREACRVCPVLADCRARALSVPPLHDPCILAGLDADQRKGARKRAQSAQKDPPPVVSPEAGR